MDCENVMVYSKPYYKLIQEESIEDKDVYYKFVNWLLGEFDLYLQENSTGLKVYYPSGWLSIKKRTDFTMEIIIASKSKIVCEKKYFQLVSIYNQVKRTFRYN
ncbi:hypothetical protein CJ739_2398 [Mariniflexile rhizosphaerae]|uniref:hypothetical protein n=1 Tax=unclassified Mariniflexile TaxID=2643887 RepID=UPI000E3327B2|nr:hypothetical protein [Mariniflexile sp. TRM1-10]AXP81471.1 hypothetical protein CJ739_2398 [Mariniflexile sp. TRM1-10]